MYVYSFLQWQLYKCSEGAVTQGQVKAMSEDQLFELIQRCLLSLPCKQEVPHQPGRYWLDYTRHNDIIDLVLPCLPDASVSSFYEKMITWMPDNLVLCQRWATFFYL